MEHSIMVDSNVFIALIKRRGDPSPWLSGWAGHRKLAICGMVRLEVMRGVKSLRAYRNLADFMDAMLNVSTTSKLWESATTLAWQLDRKGRVIPGSDVLIAASALSIDAAILTSDGHFSHVDGLRVIAPPAEWLV